MRRMIRLNMKWRIFLTALLLLLICGAAIAIYALPKILSAFEQPSINYRALWDAKGSPNYQIEIVTGSPPAPEIGWDLIVQNGQITHQSIIACDHPSQEYPAEACDYLRQYYSWMGKYTIAQLFDIADEGIHSTQRALLKCNLLTGNSFDGFSTINVMIGAAQSCGNSLGSSDTLYTVDYDSDYGYPKSIANYTPGVMDGSTHIEVKEFRIIPAT